MVVTDIGRLYLTDTSIDTYIVNFRKIIISDRANLKTRCASSGSVHRRTLPFPFEWNIKPVFKT